MKRDFILLGAGYMMGLAAGILAVILATGQSAPEVPAAKAWHLVELNGKAVPFWGWLDGERLVWTVDEQTWSTAPGEACDAGGRRKGWYLVTINQAETKVKGWVDAAGGLAWCWADQSRSLARSGPAAVNPAGAMANGVDVGKLDGRSVVRASDAATAGEVRAVMQAAKPPEAAPCKPDSAPSKPDRIKPPDLAGGSWLPSGPWLWLGVAALLVFAVAGVVVAVVCLLVFLHYRKAAKS